MGQPVSRSYMCCAVRDKDGGEGAGLGKTPQFTCIDAEVSLVDEACFMTFAPLYTQEASKPRRLAVASTSELRVFQLQGAAADLTASLAGLSWTHRLRLGSDRRITALLFADDDSSRQLAVALAPAGQGAAVASRGAAAPVVKIFTCDGAGPTASSTGEAPGAGVEWCAEGDALATLDGFAAEVVKVVANRQHLLAADASGQVAVWQKPKLLGKVFERKVLARCHSDGIADLAVDRSFAYTVGRQENRICVWQLPELSPMVLSLPVDLHEELLNGLPPPSGLPPTLALAMPSAQDTAAAAAAAAPRAAAPRSPIARINLIRRPLSRWAGAPNVSKGVHPVRLPRGCLFVAAILGANCDVAGPGAGLLMEWTLGERANLHSVQVAHDSPIVSLTYGPYDNGPLITADVRGTFRVWEFSLDRGLLMSQQLSIMSLTVPRELGSSEDPWSGFTLPARAGWPVVAVEPPTSVYIVVGGRLFVCQRLADGAVVAAVPQPPASPRQGQDPRGVLRSGSLRGPRLSTTWAN